MKKKPRPAAPKTANWVSKKNLLLTGFWVTLGVFCLYARTGSPTLISCGDSAEMTGAAASFGVAHAPGYPIFTMGGGLFAALLPGTPAQGVNLFNAFCGALAVGALFFVLFLLTEQLLPSIAGALTFGFSYHFWLYSHVPEICALNALFIGLLLLCVLTRQLYWLAFCVGLAFTHHHSIVFLMPGIFIYFLGWVREKSITVGPRHWLILGLLFMLGLIPYLYIPLRAHEMPFMNAGTVTSVSRFIDHVTRRAYGTMVLTQEFSPFNEMALESTLSFYGSSLVKSFSWPGVGVGLVGFGMLLWKKPRIFLLLGLSWVLMGPFFLGWCGMPATSFVLQAVIQRFFVGSFYLFAIGIGVGLAVLTRKSEGSRFLRTQRWIGMGLAFVLPLWAFGHNYKKSDLSDFDLCEVYSRDLAASLPQNAVVLVHGDNSLFSLWHLQCIQHARPDLKILNSNMSPPYADHLRFHFPELGLAPRATPTTKEMISLALGRFPVCIIGIPGTEFRELGLLGNPLHLRPRGLALEIVAEEDSEDSVVSVPMEFNGRIAAAWRESDIAKEILYLYTIGHYNRAVIHAAQGHFRAAYDAAQRALEVDPQFELARDLSNRMVGRVNGTPSPRKIL